MDGKLRSSIPATFTMLDRFRRGWLKDATTGDTTLVPAPCFQGVIVILDMSRSSLCSTIHLTQSLNSICTKLGDANAHDRGLRVIASLGVRIHCANNCTLPREVSRGVGTAGTSGLPV